MGGSNKSKSKSSHGRSSSPSRPKSFTSRSRSKSPIKPTTREEPLRKSKSDKNRLSSSSSSKKSGSVSNRDDLVKKSKSSSSKSFKTNTGREEDLLRKTKSEHHRSSSPSSSSRKRSSSQHRRSSQQLAVPSTPSSSSRRSKRTTTDVLAATESSSRRSGRTTDVLATPSSSRRSRRTTDVLATPARTSSKKNVNSLYIPDLSTCPASPRKVEKLRGKCRNIEGWHDDLKKNRSSDRSMMDSPEKFYDEEEDGARKSRTSKSTEGTSSESGRSTTNNHSTSDDEKSWFGQLADDHYNKRNIIFASVIVISLFLIVVLALVGLSGGGGRGDDPTISTSNLRPQQTVPTESGFDRPRQPTSEGPGYSCYKSTLDMYTDQIDFDPDPNVPMDRPLIICPNTTINVGVLNFGQIFDVEYRDGDFPITPFRKNVVVQCGEDGKRSNNCIIQGGLTQVRAHFRQWHPTKGDVQPADTIDLFTVRGVTFTGTISSIPYSGTSVEISHPGVGIEFEDCAWTGITATNAGLINVGKTSLMAILGLDVEDLSVELTVSNSVFESITYNQLFIKSVQQVLTVQNTVFRDVVLSTPEAAGCDTTDGGCRSLIYSPPGGPSRLSVSSLCVQNVDVQDAGPIVVSDLTDWSPSGVNIWVGPSEFVGGESTSNNDEDEFCDMGVALLEGSGNSHSCLGIPLFEEGAEGSCDFF